MQKIAKAIAAAAAPWAVKAAGFLPFVTVDAAAVEVAAYSALAGLGAYVFKNK